MAMFRSETMSLCQLFIQPEAVYSTVAELGEAGIAQFKDLNDSMVTHEKKYTSEIRRIDEMERKLEVINVELKKDEIEVPEHEDEPRYPSSREIIDLEALIEKHETEIKELSMNVSQLLENQRGFIEYRCVLERAEIFLTTDAPSFKSDDDSEENHQLHVVAGVVDLEKYYGFERMLWRVTMGNIFMKNTAIGKPFKDPVTNKDIFKMVFIAFFQGDLIKSKVKKVCDGYRATTFPCPNDVEERMDIKSNLQMRIADMDLVINQTSDHRQRVLNYAAKSFYEWTIKVKKLKAIYHIMNYFSIDLSQKCVIGECWIPTADIQLIKNALMEGSKVSESTVPSFINVIGTKETPPTYIRTNKFTKGFQNLIDSYGIASYREVNPGFFTIVTFPFLFSVMFGDLGHGMILVLFGGWMVLNEKKLMKIKEEIFGLFFSGRYIILMMGIFSIYSGFIYNDIFAKSMNIFGSSWSINYNTSTVMENAKLQLNPSDIDLQEGRTYPMGVDPVWQLATDNKILFLNSFKMKLSIVLGISHMLFGLTLSCVNYNQFKTRSFIILQYVPQVIFLVLLFGYMVFMMFFKWIMYDPKSTDLAHSPGCAPSVLVMFINMMLVSKNKLLDGCEDLYPNQRIIQIILVLIAVCCVPWMLCGKPIYIMMQRKKRPVAALDSDTATTLADSGKAAAAGGHEHEEPMSEIWMHQGIHTIEFVLGTVSHTASYLRLWALSLAHAQLSEVVWTKLMPIAFMNVPYVGFILVYYLFFMWACCTLGILVVIEGLSAFLHTLRLHWVEFMDKFYEGEGIKFTPFAFKTVLYGDE